MNSTALLASLGLSLALTIAFEASVFLLAGKNDKKDLLLLLLANVITNPIVVLSFWLAAWYTSWNTYIVLIPLELFAIITEGCIYKRYGNSFRRPFLFSFLANMASFWAGVLIQQLF